jgi:hypothetical protein
MKHVNFIVLLFDIANFDEMDWAQVPVAGTMV